ncbi:Exocellobiohydrolase [Auricularia subglabra TFB-10046 SS5]|nr:Exocellobiohydrolase [Auricularia subglabra TFB-10046 SS5]
MFPAVALLSFSLLATVLGQQVGTNTAETHPTLSWQKCTGSGSSVLDRSIVLDANWRWLHTTTGYTNCYTGNTWNTTLCPDGETCAQNCALDGADYSGTYGISTSGNALTLNFITNGQQKNIGSRVYLLASESKYEMFKLLNQEFTFDVDVSNLPCGLNGAVYFSQMTEDGGMADLHEFSTNKAGAKYGTGYCDSQCPHDIKFINGVANVEGWAASPNDTNAGTGNYGACCAEMDIWEANSISAAVTPHPCTQLGLTRCTGNDCGDGDNRYGGICDKDGCDFNSFRMGEKDFYGPGSTVDTKQKITVVTQFLTSTNSSSGTLSEIRRVYVQNGNVIANSKTNFPGIDAYDSVSTDFCTDQKTLFGDTNSFQDKGGLQQMGAAMAEGMVLVLSIWDDHAVNMLWLDSDYPTDADAFKPGISRGTCATTSGKPTDVEQQTGIKVTYSNIRFGDIGSTYTGSAGQNPGNPGTTTGGGTPTSTTSAPQATQTKYGQCGGTGYSGPTVCESGTTCKAISPPYYSQCL